MKLSSTQNRILGALLVLLALLLAYFLEGLFLNFSAGALTGAGVLLLINGSLKPKNKI